jgi:hypothetical protein
VKIVSLQRKPLSLRFYLQGEIANEVCILRQIKLAAHSAQLVNHPLLAATNPPIFRLFAVLKTRPYQHEISCRHIRINDKLDQMF